MEQWLKEAKKRAKDEAEYIASEIADIADSLNVEREWFFEEVVMNINKMKNGGVE